VTAILCVAYAFGACDIALAVADGRWWLVVIDAALLVTLDVLSGAYGRRCVCRGAS
jgi:hypothetical protein